MLLSTYYAICASALLFTLLWLLVPDRRVTFTALAASGLWFLASVSGAGVEVVTDSGTRVGADVAALQYPALAFGVLSLLVVPLYWFDHYPPEDTPAAGDTQPAEYQSQP